MPVLGQTIEWNGILTWVVVIVGVAILLSVVLVWIRRSIVADDAPMTGLGFGPADLDAMLERGELTPDEHRRAREKMLARMVGREESAPPPPPPPPPDADPDAPTPPDSSDDPPAPDAPDKSAL